MTNEEFLRQLGEERSPLATVNRETEEVDWSHVEKRLLPSREERRVREREEDLDGCCWN